MRNKPKLFTKGAIVQMIIAAFCIAGGLFIIIFNIVIYPKFSSLIYSVIGLFVLVIVLLLIATSVIVRYQKTTKEYDSAEDKILDIFLEEEEAKIKKEN